jgi:GT2 family glycosyltransferase
VTGRVAAVVATFNGESYIAPLMESLRKQGLALSRVTVVDNASADGTCSIVKRQFPEVDLNSLPENRGFGAASNVGIARAMGQGGELILVLNQDVTLESSAIEEAVRAMDAAPEVGLLGLFQLNYDGSGIDPVFCRYLPVAFWDDLLLRELKPVYEVPFVPAAAVLLRGACVRDVGAFDPLFFMYLEDRDLCHRLTKNGWRVGVATFSRVRHDCGQLRVQKDTQWSLNWHYSQMLYHLKTSPRSLPVALLTAARRIFPHFSMAVTLHRAIAWLRCLTRVGRIARHRRQVPAPGDMNESGELG